MKDIKSYANSFQQKSRLGLESIGLLLKKLGNPQDELKFIHVAGTNGKGSVCAFLQCILSDSGLKTGKYISPNMIEVYERISIDGENIKKADMEKIMDKVLEKALEVEKETGVLPTQFELWTAAAFLYFLREKCDIVVLETGLGGRLDATNIIQHHELCVITRIDIDHIEYLGGTIEAIAAEKAGIMKKGCPVLSAMQKEEAMAVLENAAKEKEAFFMTVPPAKNIHNKGMAEIFDYNGYKELEINLSGIHQVENACVAIAAAEKLGIEEKHIRSGIIRARNMGRFEKLSDSPTVIFDGAHNLSGTQTLTNALGRYFSDKKINFIYGAMADKDITASIEHLKKCGYAEKSGVFTVMVKDNPRAQTAEKLSELFDEKGFTATPCKSIKDALCLSMKKADVTVICGSLYLYKDTKEQA